MANINLLPWREELRAKNNKDFQKLMVLVFILAAVASFFVLNYFQSSVSNQNARNNYLQQEIAVLDTKIVEIEQLKKSREDLIERMELIQALQGNRPVIVRVFDEVARSVPEDLYFRHFSISNSRVNIKGVTESNHRLSSLMRNFDGSEWFKDPSLVKVQASGEGANEFEIEMIRVEPQQDNQG